MRRRLWRRGTDCRKVGEGLPSRKQPLQHLQQDQDRGGDQDEVSVTVVAVEHDQDDRSDEASDQDDDGGDPETDHSDGFDNKSGVVEASTVV